MSDEDQEIIEICNTVHSIMQSATHDLPIPDPKKTRDIRKKISVFTYGVIIELTEKNNTEKYMVVTTTDEAINSSWTRETLLFQM